MEESKAVEGALRARSPRTLEQDVTDDFCAAFGDDPVDYRGAVQTLIAQGILPAAVDDKDPRVTEIIRRCREAYPDAPWAPDLIRWP